MKKNIFSQRCRWSILVLILGLSGCAGLDHGKYPDEVPVNCDINQNQLNQWIANNEINANPPPIAILGIAGCVSST